MTPTTLAAALLRDVPRFFPDWNREMMMFSPDADYVDIDNVLAALTAALAAAVPADLAEAGKVLEGVTPGPWRVGPVDDCRVEDANGNEVAQIDGDYNQPETWPLMEANARFIAWCREGVPALLAQNAALRAKVAEVELECDRLHNEFHKQKNKVAKLVEALTSLPAVYAHQINTGVREVYDPLQRFYTMESVLTAITEATQ